MNYIRFFSQIGIADIPLVGGKNASLGEMIQQLTPLGIRVPLGFAITTEGYWAHLKENHLLGTLKQILAPTTNSTSIEALSHIGAQARNLIYQAPLPADLIAEIEQAYRQLSDKYQTKDLDVAVRSSATAEDLPHASFAGQQETYLHIQGSSVLLDSVKKCMASLFTDRALFYRREQGLDHFQVAISVGVQKMVRSDKATAGVAFSLDTDSGFRDVVVITSSYGLGENVVKGVVNPDEFHVHEPTLQKGFPSIIKKTLGSKELKLVYTDNAEHLLENIPVPVSERNSFSLTDDQILLLAKQVIQIEEYYSTLNKQWTPMDIEWAIDGLDKQLYIVQARPETVYSQAQEDVLITYSLTEAPPHKALLTGLSIGQKIAAGKAHILHNLHEQTSFNKGDILVTQMTDPDWVPLMKKAAAIVTDKGGRTCHAAIVSRELGIPAIVGTSVATDVLHTGREITIDCSQGSQGYVYEGIQPFHISKTELKSLPKPPVPILMNLADPASAYTLSFMPVAGVGLARLEFIITNSIKVHPMAICQPEKIRDPLLKAEIEALSAGYANPTDFFVSTLSQGIAQIAAAFYPREVIVRLSDFKSNEYRNLIAGEYFEPYEENPMLGFRGAVRYCDPGYAPAFALECQALLRARSHMGLTNIKILVPFVRTVYEASCTIAALEKEGVIRGQNGLQILMMCEIPSNVLLLEKFAEYFDGFSIGSNDLTQFTLAVDRDSAQLSNIFDERDEAVKLFFKMAIEKAISIKKPMSICGQAPSDYPEIADYLIQNGISALSLNPDSVIPFLLRESGQR